MNASFGSKKYDFAKYRAVNNEVLGKRQTTAFLFTVCRS